jgi:hypothetical protein
LILNGIALSLSVVREHANRVLRFNHPGDQAKGAASEGRHDIGDNNFLASISSPRLRKLDSLKPKTARAKAKNGESPNLDYLWLREKSLQSVLS